MKLLISGTPRKVIEKVGVANYQAHYGVLASPRHYYSIEKAMTYGVPWAMDNDCFTGFNETLFRNSLAKRVSEVATCWFVVSPDVVSNAAATLERFYQWEPVIRAFGYKVALAAQDGLERLTIPWDQLDCLFIGGSTKWKLSESAASIARSAKAKGKRVHMGRVNSAIRLRYAQSIGCDCVDGTGYAAFPHRIPESLPVLATRQHTLWEI